MESFRFTTGSGEALRIVIERYFQMGLHEF